VVLLHEMTHTSGGGYRDDVKVANGGPFGLGRGVAYGWENMKRLAKTRPYVDMGKNDACDNNADSLAYFALGKGSMPWFSFFANSNSKDVNLCPIRTIHVESRMMESLNQLMAVGQ